MSESTCTDTELLDLINKTTKCSPLKLDEQIIEADEANKQVDNDADQLGDISVALLSNLASANDSHLQESNEGINVNDSSNIHDASSTEEVICMAKEHTEMGVENSHADNSDLSKIVIDSKHEVTLDKTDILYDKINSHIMEQGHITNNSDDVVKARTDDVKKTLTTEDDVITKNNDLIKPVVAAEDFNEYSKGELVTEVEKYSNELESTKRQLMKSERLLEKANNYNEVLRNMVETLSSDLHRYKHSKTRSIHVQVDKDDLLHYATGEHTMPCWEPNTQSVDMDTSPLTSPLQSIIKMILTSVLVLDSETEPGFSTGRNSSAGESSPVETISIADSLKAAASEVVQQQTNEAMLLSGYVFDEGSGLYYHPTSGYYYDSQKSLYYEPNTGTYYYYDYDTGQYQFHSQVDLSTYNFGNQQPTTQNTTFQGVQFQQRRSPVKPKVASDKKKKKKKEKDPKHEIYKNRKERRQAEQIRQERRKMQREKHEIRKNKYQTHNMETDEERQKSQKKKKNKEKRKNSYGNESGDKKLTPAISRSRSTKRNMSRRLSRKKNSYRSNSRTSNRSLSKSPIHHRSKSRSPFMSRSRTFKKSVSKSRSRSRIRSMNRSRSRSSKKRSMSMSRSRSKSWSKNRLISRSVSKNRSNSRLQSRSRSKSIPKRSPYRSRRRTRKNYNSRSRSRSGSDSPNRSKNNFVDYNEYKKQYRLKNIKLKRKRKDSDDIDIGNCDVKSGSMEGEKHTKKVLKRPKGDEIMTHNLNCTSDTVNEILNALKRGVRNDTTTSGDMDSDRDFKNKLKNASSSEIEELKWNRDFNEHHRNNRGKYDESDKRKSRNFRDNDHYQLGSHSEFRKRNDKHLDGCEDTRGANKSLKTQNEFGHDFDCVSISSSESDVESGELTNNESGELTDSESEKLTDSDSSWFSSESSSSDWTEEEDGREMIADKPEEAEVAGTWPPCIRMIVSESDCIDVGMLFIVTCAGATIGRDKEMNHDIYIQDINISKLHAEIHYNETNRLYEITDKGSQNGTFVNSIRISQQKKISQAAAIIHGDIVQVGNTKLLCHIHPGSDTCDDCEPGIVMANYRAQQPQFEIKYVSKEDRKKQQRLQLSQIKKKYGLKNAAYEDNKEVFNNPNYTDKAAERRKAVGSDTQHVKQENPASVHKPLPSGNIGHKLLLKMGWKEGESLGKDNSGIQEPIQVRLRTNQSAGLGSGNAGVFSADDANSVDMRKANRRLQAQHRFNKLAQDGNDSGDKRAISEKFVKAWTKGETEFKDS